jgi:hypothetical protein
MPEWIHERAKHILAKNPSMPKSMAFGLATQQSHALGKSPKGYGTSEGRSKAKGKYDTPKVMEHKANPGELDTPKLATALLKLAFIEALPAITGIASGYAPGREVAGQVGEELAPEGHKRHGEQWGRNAAMIGVPLGGLAAMAIAHRFKVAPRLADFAERHFKEGLIADPGAERELINLGVPGVAAIGGSLLGGGLSGAAAGGLQHLREPVHEKTAAMKMGRVLLAITKTATGQAIPVRHEKEDAETGDETDPPIEKESGVKSELHSPRLYSNMRSILSGESREKRVERHGGLHKQRKTIREAASEGWHREKEAEDYGGHEGFSTNQYSGVMNPPTLPYKSGVPPWQEPPVKTVMPQPMPDYTKESGLASELEEQATHERPSSIRIPSSVAGLADDAVVLGKRLSGRQGSENPPEEQHEFKMQLGRPLSPMDQEFFNRGPEQPLSAAWRNTEANPEVKQLRGELGRNLNIGAGIGALGGGALGYALGHPILGALGGGLVGATAGSSTRSQQVTDARNRIYAEETAKMGAAGLTPLGRLNSAKAIGAPKTTAAPGPSIAQIAKPKGFGMPLSGAKKGNNII